VAFAIYIGQEAVVTGMQMAIKAGDKVITGYRDHGHMLARHGSQGRDGRVDRAAWLLQGQGGSMHMFSVETGFYGGHGIVAAQVPLGTGLACQPISAATMYRDLSGRRCGQKAKSISFNMARLAPARDLHHQQSVRNGNLGCAGLSHD
jgi:hypothetical protein